MRLKLNMQTFIVFILNLLIFVYFALKTSSWDSHVPTCMYIGMHNMCMYACIYAYIYIHMYSTYAYVLVYIIYSLLYKSVCACFLSIYGVLRYVFYNTRVVPKVSNVIYRHLYNVYEKLKFNVNRRKHL